MRLRPIPRFSRRPAAFRLNRNLAISTSCDKEPFYGAPAMEPSLQDASTRLSTFMHMATQAILDPTRADCVAAVGELTGTHTLKQLYECLQSSHSGRRILEERPVVSKATIPYKRLLDEARTLAENGNADSTGITFGQSYGRFLLQHGFDPDGRDEVKYVEDQDLAYVMLRYRQCHDFWHALTGLPPTVLGELALKHVELYQTGLPLAALSLVGGRWSLNDTERATLDTILVPWARRVGQSTPYGTLLTVYYEEEWDTPLVDLQSQLGLEPAPFA